MENQKPIGNAGGIVKTITLTRGQVTIVDDADFDWLNQWRWRASWSKYTRTFYAVRSAYRTHGPRDAVYMHRLILGLVKGDGKIGDHIDPSSTLDNRRSNLRVATISQNNSNCRLRRDNACGLKGVYFDTRSGKWRAQIGVHGTVKNLGRFSTPELAHRAYCDAAAARSGAFARSA
jgi:hypothetical protein